MTWLHTIGGAAFDVIELIVMVTGVLVLSAAARLWWFRQQKGRFDR